MTYYRLLDPAHENIIVKAEGRVQYEYEKEKGWVRSGIMLHYFSDESPTYGQYEEISEEVAFNIIKAA